MMIDVVNELFGTYNPVTTLVGDELVVVEGVSGLDIPYITGVVLFSILLSSVLACIRVVLNKI